MSTGGQERGDVGGLGEELRPPEAWPGSGGRTSVAPAVAPWPGAPLKHKTDPGAGWPGAEPRRGGGSGAGDAAVEALRQRPPAHRVAPAARAMWAVSALLGWLFPLIGIAVWMVFDDGHRTWQLGAAAVVLVLAVAHCIVMPLWRYRVHRWEVNRDAVYTQTGWFVEERRLAPIARVQTVDSERGPIERLFGLGTVTVTTASAAGPLRIEGLDIATVDRLVAELTAESARHRGDGT